MPLKVIVISDPEKIALEAEAINMLCEEGLQIFHFRKPQCDKASLEQALKLIKPGFVKRMVIHSHHELINKYNLRGIHFPERSLAEIGDAAVAIKKLQKKSMTVSTSFHSIKQLSENNYPFDYVFLSPVFNSISKPDYRSSIDLGQFTSFISSVSKRPAVIALGGIDINKIETVRNAKFDGFALLGVIWSEFKITNDIDKLKADYVRIVNS